MEAIAYNCLVFSAESLLASARDQTGLKDMGAGGWQEGLDRLVDSLGREARLSEVGEQIATAQLVGFISARLRVTDWHSRHPEIGEAPVPPPVVINGQPRTGTTILFDLLAQDPGFRVPLTWEVGNPDPPPETATYETDPRIAESEAGTAMTEALLPGFQAIHPSGARRGQECVAITAGDFRSLLYSTVFHVPSYTRWLLWEADMTSAYDYHRRFLQLLQWRHPAQRWLLKSPAHQWSLGSLFSEYPDAAIVHTHRDPLKVMASTASLAAFLQRLATDHTSVPEQAAEWSAHLIAGNERSVEAREDGTVPAGRAVDVQFGDLMADPFGTIATTYERLGIPYTAKAEKRMRHFLADNPADRHGVHRYAFSDTGLDEADMRVRTARYEEYFGVAREALD